MKINTLILTAMATMVLANACAKAPEVEPLHVIGTQLYAGDSTVCFKGMSFGWHNIWPRFYEADNVRYLHDEWGCNIFRAAIAADDFALADNPGIPGGYNTEPDFALDKLYNVIDGAIASGSYVIVDWHAHALYQDEAKEFFTRVATRYKGYNNLIFELFNEPVCFSFENGSANKYEDLGNEEAMQNYWHALKAYAEDIIATITSIDDRHPLILMGCPSWDQRIDLPASDPIDYDNIMYTVHFYAATHGPWLREATDKAMEAGIPVFISECAGCEASGDGLLDEQAWNTYTDWAQSHGISAIAWSISDKAETCSMLTKEATSIGPWDERVIKPWGMIVRNWLTDKL